ncbi:galactose-1-phosphate uridylyltransferase [Caldanaerobius polysaccharolyticus]|uniref:galactose-1-phosphate uridylyltransferase n=1 Tax=Caldanaerobius polysaccharolyticus TaxID=44256 RepID=UPI00047E676E|nr:galactose-1-phosphate uridylyltransferase [Caldanaerobius polysaccharolyticus]
MAELRWNPLLGDWVMIASHRQERPQMPKDWCPFCPGSGRVPDGYDVLEYDNDFPALMQNPPAPDDVETSLYKVSPAYGKCEVILYSPNHTITLPELEVEHIKKLVDLWSERFTALKRDERIKYIFIFENRGEVVGVTMPHPHGQIYGYSWVPLKIKRELELSRRHYEDTGQCLICRITEEEYDFKKRIIMENDHFVTYLPFFTEYPYGVFISAKRHVGTIDEFTPEERQAFAEILKYTTGTLDALFDYKFPYMMCMHQLPVNGEEDFSDCYHFHVEFYPPMRSRDKQKFNASSETGAWAPCNTTSPEEKAEELRRAYEKFKEKMGRVSR